jgi:hypothetical protein
MSVAFSLEKFVDDAREEGWWMGDHRLLGGFIKVDFMLSVENHIVTGKR